MCVIFNPVAARGRAKYRLERLRQALGTRADFQPTLRPGHAEELALEAAHAGFPVVAAAGGDGTLHEVANGMLRAGRPDVTFAVFPMGSANDYAFTLGLTLEDMIKEGPAKSVRRVDVGLVRSETGRQRYFVNGLGLGFNGAVTLETRRIRWLQGLPLYLLGFLGALWRRYHFAPMEVAFDGQALRTPTFALSVAIGKREGNLVVAPHAVPDDGLFDYLHVGTLSRLEILRYLPRLATGGELPADHPAIRMGRCREIRVRSEVPVIVHLDGEFFCLPEDGIRELDIRILPGLLRVRV
jgi:diacylglycerol kinase family enzyme